jgi:hypothetical protein
VLERYLGPPGADGLQAGGSPGVSRLPVTDPVHTDGEEGRSEERGSAQGGSSGEEGDSAEMGASMRAVAPPVQSFASGRRR